MCRNHIEHAFQHTRFCGSGNDAATCPKTAPRTGNPEPAPRRRASRAGTQLSPRSDNRILRSLPPPSSPVVHPAASLSLRPRRETLLQDPGVPTVRQNLRAGTVSIPRSARHPAVSAPTRLDDTPRSARRGAQTRTRHHCRPAAECKMTLRVPSAGGSLMVSSAPILWGFALSHAKSKMLPGMRPNVLGSPDSCGRSTIFRVRNWEVASWETDL